MWNFKEYQAYLEQYAAHFKLEERFYFGREVVGIERPSDGGPYWRVLLTRVDSGVVEEQRASLLLLTTGSHSQPKLPNFDMANGEYDGEICHSANIKDFGRFQGKRVVCMGVGESGSDIPLFIKQQPGTEVYISMRGCGWIFTRTRPRKGGLPADLNTNRVLWGLPSYMNGLLSYYMASGDAADKTDPVIQLIGKLNLQHPGGVYKTYGTKSASFAEAIVEHGAVLAPQVAQLGPGKRVEFTDGTVVEADVIVCNTGYGAPVFEQMLAPNSTDGELRKVLQECSCVRSLYKRCVHPDLPNRLFLVGFARPQHGSIPPIAELQARWLAAAVTGKAPSFPCEEQMRLDIQRDKRREEKLFDGAAARVGALVDYISFTNDVAALFGATPPWWQIARAGDWKLLFQLFFAIHSTIQFRLAGPGACPELARKTILSFPVTRRRKAVPLLLYVIALQVYVLARLLFPVPQAYLNRFRPNGFGEAQYLSPVARAAQGTAVAACVYGSLGCVAALAYVLVVGVLTWLEEGSVPLPSSKTQPKLSVTYSTATELKQTKARWIKGVAHLMLAP
jgi:dimethylaniline monooxygenase (N-oxide forming)